MAKRKTSPTRRASTLAKRARQDQQYTNIKSIRQQAEPYQLGTARFPINALTPTWRIGSNRPIDKKHVQDLSQIFEKQLQREQEENHLRIACSRIEFQRMTDHLQKAEKSASELWPAFDDWMSVNKCKAEIMSGQHRVEALRVFLARIGTVVAKEQSWWICDIYDQGNIRPRLCSLWPC